jgi:hypothetical protein
MAEVKSDAQIALECASLVFAESKTSYTSTDVTRLADTFLRWLNAHDDRIDLSK